MGMPDIHHADASGEVDVALAADVPQLGAFGAVGRDGVGAADAPRDVLGAKLGELGLRGRVAHAQGGGKSPPHSWGGAGVGLTRPFKQIRSGPGGRGSRGRRKTLAWPR